MAHGLSCVVRLLIAGICIALELNLTLFPITLRSLWRIPTRCARCVPQGWLRWPCGPRESRGRRSGAAVAAHAIMDAWSLRSRSCRGRAPSGHLTSEGAHHRGSWLRCHCGLRPWRAKECSVALIRKHLPFALNVLRGALVPTGQGLPVETGCIKGSGHGDLTCATTRMPSLRTQAMSVERKQHGAERALLVAAPLSIVT